MGGKAAELHPVVANRASSVALVGVGGMRPSHGAQSPLRGSDSRRETASEQVREGRRERLVHESAGVAVM